MLIFSMCVVCVYKILELWSEVNLETDPENKNLIKR